MGAPGDRIGRRRILLIGVTTFSAASPGAAFARALGHALAALDERAQKIISLRFCYSLTQAKQVGISQVHVSRLHTQIGETSA